METRFEAFDERVRDLEETRAEQKAIVETLGDDVREIKTAQRSSLSLLVTVLTGVALQFLYMIIAGR